MNKLFLLLTLFSISAHALSAKDIMTKNEEARKVNEFETRAKLTTGSSGGTPKIKDFTLWRKVQADGIHNSTLTRFHAPAEVRDEGILITENGSGKNDVLLYLPNFKKIRRVESQQQSGSFMGSVFSYSDIATPHVDDYQYKTLGSEKCSGDAKLMCTKIECIPSNEEVKDRTGYSKSIVWVRPDNFMVERAEYYQIDGKLWKSLKATEIKMVDSKNKKWLAHSLSIVNQINKDFTDLQFSNVKVNSGISDAIFTQQNLQKVK
jgi:outer membrane lipoprotein-sorting protein